MPSSGPPERQKPPWASAGVGLGQGWSILVEPAAIIGLFAYLGYRLDRALGTKPVLFAVLMVVGYAGGVMHVWIWIRRRNEDENAKRER